MLNAVGLQNPGLDVVLEEELPFMRSQNATIIANIAGETMEDYIFSYRAIAKPRSGCN